MRAAWLAATLVLTAPIILVATPARAETGAEAPSKTPTVPPALSATSADEDAANQLVEQAARAYDDGRLDDALSMLARAYDLSPRPAIIYNQAQVMRAKHDCAAALQAYGRFIAATLPGDPNRDRAARHQAEMQTCVDEKRPSGAASQAPAEGRADKSAPGGGVQPPPPAPAAPTPAAPVSGAPPVRLTLDREPGVQTPRKIAASMSEPVPPQEKSGARRLARVSGWALLGVSVVSAGAAAVLAWKAAQLQSEASQDLETLLNSKPPLWSRDSQSRIDEGVRDAHLARWCAAAAALSASGGATLLIMFRSPSSPGEAARPHDAAALAGWSGVF
ncbi:MAG: hypothetical protein ABJA82_18910 [Myxococcales bacterium]